ncbi:MAG TPA: hypothetical protein VGN35_09935 [Jatrophihabitantaceae bacterium]|jgi:hypothetical protein|nr:hypothetical protein [Jatrophihabitantaceae bacterium]
MTRKSPDHDRYVAKVNSLVTTGRDDMIDEMVSDYARTQESGREVFWDARRGWPVGRRR